MRILSVVGARPNFMKLAPLARAVGTRGGVEHVIVHTGQHYDPEMSESFFRDLGIAAPDENLEVGSGSHAQQTGTIMQRIEPVLTARRPDVVLVYGDVNSTVAAALVAAKLGIRVGHVEAGLRSRDWTMPEEINRVVTDRVSDLLLCPSPDEGELWLRRPQSVYRIDAENGRIEFLYKCVGRGTFGLARLERGRVDPVEILKHEERRLARGGRREIIQQGVERLLLPLLRREVRGHLVLAGGNANQSGQKGHGCRQVFAIRGNQDLQLLQASFGIILA